MTRDEAKEILHACRPGRRDADDPRIAEALAFAETDPELRDWFKESQQWDADLADALKQAPIPAGLREQVRRGAVERAGERRRAHHMPLTWAASLALLGVLIALWMTKPWAPEQGPVSALSADMAAFIGGSPGLVPRLDIATDRLAEVREWLAGQHAIAEVEFPDRLEQFPSIGCRTVEWRGHKLALVCFMVDGTVVHLFMIPGDALPEAGLAMAPQYAKVDRYSTASWRDDDTGYLALTRGNEEFLRQRL